MLKKLLKSSWSSRDIDRLQAALPDNRRKNSFMESVFAKRMTAEILAKLNPPRSVFIPLDKSPHSSLRQYSSALSEYSSCPVCVELHDNLPESEWNDIHKVTGGTVRREKAVKSRLRPTHVCDSCGFPTHCSKDHYDLDKESHSEVCGILKQFVEDEHDIRSGRKFWETTFPGRQNAENVLNFSSWAHLFHTRSFMKPLLKSPVAQRNISRYLTYPYTIASILYNPFTYSDTKQNSDSSVTDYGMHILSPLSHGIQNTVKNASNEHKLFKSDLDRISFTSEPTAPSIIGDPYRIFIVGAAHENQLPSFVWEQISNSFPGVPLRLYFIGPETVPPKTSTWYKSNSIVPSSKIYRRPISSDNAELVINSLVLPVTVNLRMEYLSCKYESVHESLGPFNRRRDVFVLFNSGVGHYLYRDSWKPAIQSILKTKCLALFTSLSERDQEYDVKAIEEDYAGDFSVVIRPTKNKFSSMKVDIPADCLHEREEWVKCNYGIFAISGVGTDVGERLHDFNVESKPKSFLKRIFDL
jgi:splicing suppressor protein 51